jgi:hypothetical protein
MKAVDIFLDRNTLQHAGHFDVRRQRQLHQDAVDGDVVVELLDVIEQLLFSHRFRQLDEFRANAHFLAA